MDWALSVLSIWFLNHVGMFSCLLSWTFCVPFTHVQYTPHHLNSFFKKKKLKIFIKAALHLNHHGLIGLFISLDISCDIQVWDASINSDIGTSCCNLHLYITEMYGGSIHEQIPRSLCLMLNIKLILQSYTTWMWIVDNKL